MADVIEPILEQLLRAETPRVERYMGTIVVNPQPNARHAMLINRTVEFFAAHGWPHAYQGVAVAVGGNGYFVPDLVVVEHPEVLDPDEWRHPLDRFVAVVEVSSPSTVYNDYGYKLDVYGAAGLVYIAVNQEDRSVSIFGHTDFEVDEMTEALFG